MPSTADGADQSAVVSFLAGRIADGDTAERIDTHISHVFLTGNRALKLKRAVCFPYLDFSTIEARRRACEAEVHINRRTAPALYLGVRAVTLEADGSLALDGEGPPVDWVVEMARFDQETLFDRMVQAGALDEAIMRELAESIAEFHETAVVVPDAGGADILRMIMNNNRAVFAVLPSDHFDGDVVQAVNKACHLAWQHAAGVLGERAARGRVRQCHGDLHLRNICLVDGRPTLFDAIEFNDEFSKIDVLYDLAFLLMDLEHRGHRDLASVVMNHYLDWRADEDGLAALPLFLAVRAAIRAHVTATMALSEMDDGRRRLELEEARAYLGAAADFLKLTPPVVVAVGGLSGSGKSTVARGLAPFLGGAPGARVLRADVERKRLMGVPTTQRLPDEAYGREVTRRTFEHLFSTAANIVAAGRAVILDSVFAASAHRDMAANVARDAGVPFMGIWLDAPESTRLDRVGARIGDVSDADARVLALQATYDLGEIDWRQIAAHTDAAGTLAEVRHALGPLCQCQNSAS